MGVLFTLLCDRCHGGHSGHRIKPLGTSPTLAVPPLRSKCTVGGRQEINRTRLELINVEINIILQ